MMAGLVRDLMGLAGLGLLGAGLWMWWPPAALMVCGALLLVVALASALVSSAGAGPRERPPRTPPAGSTEGQ